MLARHVLGYDRDGAPWAYGSRQAGELWLEVPGVVTFHVPAGGAVMTAIVDDGVDTDAVLDAYYGIALPLALQATLGFEALHASGVLVRSRSCVAAFCGMSESGKSTVAYELAARGHRPWADDAVAFHVDGTQSVTAVGLPFTIKLRESSKAFFQAAGVDVDPSADRRDAVEDGEWASARLGAVFLLAPSERECP